MSIKTETRSVEHFTSVELRGVGEITLVQNPEPGQPESLIVEADETILPKLTSKVKEGKLILGWDFEWWDFLGWINWVFAPKKVRYIVTMNQIDGISIQGSGSLNSKSIRTEQCNLLISGSGKMVIDDVKSDRLTVSISGSGDYILKGKASIFQARISGSGRIRAEEMVTDETSVTISGSGNVSVEVSRSLDVVVSGSGSVRYKGNPKINQSISGSGRVSAF